MRRKSKWTGYKVVTVALALVVALLMVYGIAEAYPDPQPPLPVSSVETDSVNDFSYTVPAGIFRLLVVSVMTGSDQSASSVTYNALPLTLAVIEDEGSAQVELWYRVMGNSGSPTTANVVITFPGAADPSVGTAVTYFGVDQSDPIGISDGASLDNCSAGVSVTLTGMATPSVVHAAIAEDDDDEDSPKFASINVSEYYDGQTGDGGDLSYWAGFSLVDTNGEREVGAVSDDGEDCALAAMEIFAESDSPYPNPDLPAACGLNFILILDASFSIDATEQQAVRDASNAFLNAMLNTGSEVAVVEFSSEAITPFDWTPLNSPNLTTLQDYLDNDYHDTDIGLYTNWQDAMLEAAAVSAGGPVADMVVLVTDGDPTAYNDTNGDPLEGEPEELALLHAFSAAETVRGQGSHIFGIGIALIAGDSEGRLSAATGPDLYPIPESDFAKGDYTLTTDFDGLATALQAVAFSLCGNSLTVTKLVDDGFENVALPDFPVSGTVQVTSGGGADDFNWELPLVCDVDVTPCSQTQGGFTGEDGTFTWQWRPDVGTWDSEIDFTELSGDLTPSTPIDCSRFSLGDDAPTAFQIAGAPPWNVPFTTADIVTCGLVNTGSWDWGDAPDSYSTLGASGGPRHIMFTGDPIIGDLRDAEADGQPNAGATGDDTTGTADEDGLSIPAGSNWSDGQGEMDVDISNGPACLNAWVDFNDDANTVASDGDFDDTFEHVLVNHIVADGVNNTTFTLPIDAANDATLYMRFRVTPIGLGACTQLEQADNYLYADGIATPYNQAFGGEIQDMVVTFSPTAITLSSQSADAGMLLPAGVLVAAAALAVVTVRLLTGRSRRRAAQ